MITKMDCLGRVVVPKDVRDRPGWRPGMIIEIYEKGSEILLRPVEIESPLGVIEGILVYTGTAIGDVLGAVRSRRQERLKKVAAVKKSRKF